MTTQIEPLELHRGLKAGSIKVVDGSWALDGTDMHRLYLEGHIPDAQFFDLEAVSQRDSGLPHMAPTPQQFSEAVGHMGIHERDHVVIYDQQGLFSAARVWWTFKLMGHRSVQVLRGGLPTWTRACLDMQSGPVKVAPTTYVAETSHKNIINLNILRANLDEFFVLDARSKARFDGTASEPRAGLRSGHIPGSHNLPYTDLIRDGALKPVDELNAIFKDVGIDTNTTLVTTCGSGVTAAIISMALYEIGHTQALLYDGSWAEWGQITLDTPVAALTP